MILKIKKSEAEVLVYYMHIFNIDTDNEIKKMLIDKIMHDKDSNTDNMMQLDIDDKDCNFLLNLCVRMRNHYNDYHLYNNHYIYDVFKNLYASLITMKMDRYLATV